jgi:hypothetical protein
MEMRAAAEWYCSVIVRRESSQRVDFVAEVAQSLAELVAAASRLPQVEPSEPNCQHGRLMSTGRSGSLAFSQYLMIGTGTGPR